LETSALTRRRAAMSCALAVVGGGDAAVLEQGRAKVAHQRLARVGVPVELAAALLVSHRWS
jgi:hypothetical protein